MPSVASVAKIEFPHAVAQGIVKDYVQQMFADDFPLVERLIDAFDNTEIISRNFCKPLDYYSTNYNFEQRNKEYIRVALAYSIEAITQALRNADITKEDITDFIFVSSTGLATPSLDALIINEMHLDPHISRIPIWGLGCCGGVSGVAKANLISMAKPDAVVLVVAVELCSLTFMKNDFTKSNFIASSLFSDGFAAVIITGDSFKKKNNIRILDSYSTLYYDTLDIMGWDFLDTGFKVIFSKDIPTFIHENIKTEVLAFLAKHGLGLDDIKNFIFHPGGKKVLSAYEDSLKVEGDFLKNTRETMNAYGNMSSATVLYVLEKFMREGYSEGYGLMLAMGPGFSSEMVLLDMK